MFFSFTFPKAVKRQLFRNQQYIGIEHYQMPLFYQKEERPRLYSRLQHFARLNLNKPVSGTDNDVGVGHDETPQAGGSSAAGIENYKSITAGKIEFDF